MPTDSVAGAVCRIDNETQAVPNMPHLYIEADVEDSLCVVIVFSSEDFSADLNLFGDALKEFSYALEFCFCSCWVVAHFAEVSF